MVGVLIAPAALAGLATILWLATWLERVVAPRAPDPFLDIPEMVDAGFAVTSPRSASPGLVASHPASSGTTPAT